MIGLGKTLITLTAINELMYNRFDVNKVLVIAPKKVAEATWQKEIDKWENLKYLRISTVLGSVRSRERALNTPADIYIINRENVTWLVDYYQNAWPFDMVVVDEFSSFKNFKSKRFKSLASIKPHIKRFVGLTGTPSPNGMLDLWAQLYLLDSGQRLGRSFYQYRSQYFKSDYMGFSYKPYEGVEKVITEKISDICISMKSEDYLDLPDLIEDDVPVILDKKAEKKYKELERESVLALENSDYIDASSAAALSNKLLQLANGAVYDDIKNTHVIHDCKLEAFLELIEKLNGKSALVFYNFVSDKNRILEALKNSKLNVRVYSGPEDQDAWNRGEIDVLLTHPASSAYGLNLQQGGNHVVWYGLTWNYELYVQANKRLHRQGQKEPVIVHHLICQGTRDEDVAEALKRKEDSQNYVLESLKARINKIKREANR